VEKNMSTLLASAYPAFQLDTAKFLSELEQLEKEPVAAGVGVEGPAAAYALVWEWGNARQHQIGPRTTLGINPDGERMYLSLQAPRGYIRVNEPLFWIAAMNEMNKVGYRGTTPQEVRAELEKTAERICNRIRDILQEHVPVDTFQLHDAIRTIRVGDPLLDEQEVDNTLVLV
jgi:hypothetical protein